MPTYLSGKTGQLALANANTTMREWRLEMEAAEADISNFTSAGFAEFLTGLISSRITCSGPMDAAAQVAIGSSYAMTLGAGNNYVITFNAVLTRVTPSTAVDQAAKLDLSFRTNGVFNTTFAVAS